MDEAPVEAVMGDPSAAPLRLCAIIGMGLLPTAAASGLERHEKGPAISYFLARRFASFALTLLAASVVVFTVLDVLPSNIAEVMLGDSATPESVAALSQRLGLDRPPVTRYFDWMAGLARGDLGISVAYDTPIAGLLGERLAVTVPLAASATSA